jgi:hypothetical protein
METTKVYLPTAFWNIAYIELSWDMPYNSVVGIPHDSKQKQYSH